MVAWSPPLTGGLHANKKIEIRSAQSRDISSPNLGVVNSSQTYGMLLDVNIETYYNMGNNIDFEKIPIKFILQIYLETPIFLNQEEI